MDVLERIRADEASHPADLDVVVRGPDSARALVLFLRSRSHGRPTALDEYIAAGLEVRGFASAQVNLLAAEEQAADDRTACLHLDPGFLRARASAVLRWIGAHAALRELPLGLFADGAAAAAALFGAADSPERVRAVVCLDGRVDLAEAAYHAVHTDTLLLVAEGNTHLTDLNRHAQMHIASARLELVPNATHRYDDPRAISHVAWRTIEWFSHVMAPAGDRAAGRVD